MTATLAGFQAAFFADLLQSPPVAAGSMLAAQPGFAVYRNTVMAGCIDALAANYPTVQQLLGAEGFRAAAGAFVRAAPPSSGVLAEYGAGFADFLEDLAASTDLPYLPGVAGLDRLWTEAHLAADAPVLQAGDVARLAPVQFAAARLALHPAARWRCFDSVPAFTLWRRHRDGLAVGSPLAWGGDGGLLTRPTSAVGWIAIDRGAAAFLAACADGQSVAAAFEAALADGAEAAPFAGLPALIHAGAFARIEPGPSS